MAEKLTIQQAQAVENRGGKLLVSAAAGSGKTKVLVDRLLKYLTDPADPANLDDFLIITYTKAAASELRGKIAAKLTERIAQEPENRHLQKQIQRLFLTKISTVHGFCADVLREFTYRLDLAPDFRVADENECLQLRRNVLTDLLERSYEQFQGDPDFQAFVDTQGFGRDDRQVPKIILQVYDSARCHLDPEKWLSDCLEYANTQDKEDAGQTIWGKYLMDGLKRDLRDYIQVMDRCIAMSEEYPELEKVTLNLRSTRIQLTELAESQTWDDIANSPKLDFGRMIFPRKFSDPALAEQIKAARTVCKKGLEKLLHGFADTSAQILEDLNQSAAGTRGLIRLVRQFDAEYALAKKSRRCVDFGDLEHKTLDLFLGKHRSGPTAAAAEVSKRFREILVDEYQDSNQVQDAIFSALTAQRQNCFMVGDVKQSIYQFRLADPGIFLEKYESYAQPENAQSGQGRKILLSHNFRSGQEVIEGVNHVFKTCMCKEVGDLDYTEAEMLRPGIPRQSLPTPGVELYALDVQEDTYEEEASFVAQRIQTMLRERTLIRGNEGLRPVEPGDIVILLRSPGSVAVYYQRALEKLGIRCSSGGGTDLLKTPEIGTLRSLLQTIYNPRVDIPLVSTLASPIFGFTADDLASFRGNYRKGCLYDSLRRDDSDKVKAFLTVLETLRQCARIHGMTQLLQTCYAVTHLESIYAAMPDGAAKSENLNTFFQLASDFEKGNHRDLGQFLEYLDAMEEKGLLTDKGSVGGSVNIMSIHKSKGLEFPVVFLCALSRKFNMESTHGQLLCHKELGLGLSVADNHNRLRYPTLAKRAIIQKITEESISEELRVLYVAMTRPKDRLIMTYSCDRLEERLKDIVNRMDFDGGKFLARKAARPGDWVLLAALKRTEAGELFQLGGKPSETQLSDYPWHIRVVRCEEAGAEETDPDDQTAQLPEGSRELLRRALAFTYGHWEATKAPSKQTATDRKGRQKDTEAAEQTAPDPHYPKTWRKPAFVAQDTDGVTFGSAVHAAMQYIRYETCESPEGVAEELERLVREGFLDERRKKLVDCHMIARFFASSVGQKLRSGVNHLREFKFSILDEGENYGTGLDGEQVLLQGVVDCALLESDGITIVDFKTDRVTEETLPQLVQHYQTQVETYAHALSRVYRMPVKAKCLYFFRLDRFVWL